MWRLAQNLDRRPTCEPGEGRPAVEQNLEIDRVVPVSVGVKTKLWRGELRGLKRDSDQNGPAREGWPVLAMPRPKACETRDKTGQEFHAALDPPSVLMASGRARPRARFAEMRDKGEQGFRAHRRRPSALMASR